MSDASKADVAVVGAGAAGLAAACLVAAAGLGAVILTGTQAAADDDPRTVALMQPSIRLLAHLGLWPGELAPVAAPLWKLKIVAESGILTDGAVTFDAREVGREPFGWNMPLGRLAAALDERARSLGVGFLADAATRMQASPASARLGTEGGQAVVAKVIIGADGRASFVRAAAGIASVDWDYGQAALASTFAHSASHRDTSIEYQKEAGLITTVPMPGKRSSLIWMGRPERIEELSRFDDHEFARVLQAELHGDLGLVSDTGRRKVFPMRGLTAVSYARNRVMLIGEAAHVLPPVGAQGLNLSLRDAATAAELIATAAKLGEDPGGPGVLDRYDRLRRRDVLPRQGVIDAVNRSLSSGSTVAHAARALGLELAAQIGPLRRRIIEEGIGPQDALPRVMRA